MQDYKNYLIKNRRKYHQFPELGFLEMQTTIEIIKELRSFSSGTISYGRKIHSNRMGLPKAKEIKKHFEEIPNKDVDFDLSDIALGYTGAIFDFDTGKKGPKIGFRFDIDGLALKESSSPSHLANKLDFRSKNPNTMHACGHDGHISMGLALAKYIVDNKDALTGSYRIIFQPAEEGVRGGKSLCLAGATKDLDYLVASHIGMGLASGIVGVGTEGFLATNKFNITLRGISSHAGSSPEEGRSALLGAASLAMALHSLPQYSKGMARINVGKLIAGSSRNIVAQESFMEVETRASDEIILNDLSKRLHSATKGSAQAFELNYKIEKVGEAINYKSKYPDFIAYINSCLLNQGFITEIKPDLKGSEDVSYMLKDVEKNGGKSIHFIIGSDLEAPHHNEAFDWDESSMYLGFKVFLAVIEILKKDDFK